MKKVFAVLLVLAMLLSLAACSTGKTGETTAAPATEAVTETTVPETVETVPELPAVKTVGIVMHSENTPQWSFAGGYLKARLEADGHNVHLVYADGAAEQGAAISQLVGEHADLLIVAAVDGLTVESAGIPVIAYGGGIPSAGYQVSFGSEETGALQAQYLINKLGLADAGNRQFCIEFVGENPGALSALKPWLDSGTLTVPSGKTASTLEDFVNTLTSSCAEGATLDAVLCAQDAAEAIAALQSGYAGDNKVLIVGQGGEPESLRAIVDGIQTMTTYNSPAEEAAAALKLANALLAGESAEAAILLAPWTIDRDNLNMLAETGSFVWDAEGYLVPAA